MKPALATTRAASTSVSEGSFARGRLFSAAVSPSPLSSGLDSTSSKASPFWRLPGSSVSDVSDMFVCPITHNAGYS